MRLLYQTPLGKKVVEFGARSKGGRGSPTGSVCRDQAGLVCLCPFCFVLTIISEIFLQPPVLALSRRAAALGVCKISKNTQCGWVFFFFFFPSENFFCKSKMKYFFKTEICG